MIDRIGVLCQDVNSLGFLLGIKRRLQCEAELIQPRVRLAKSTMMTRTQARVTVEYLRKQGVDLIVRFTDADKNPWQHVKNHEESAFPNEVQSVFVCGVAVNNVEQWLALDSLYIQNVLNLPDLAAHSPDDQTSMIKNAIARQRRPDEPASEVTARIVANAPSSVFRSWLKADQSFRRFYEDCRHAAIRANCEVPNELDE